MRILPATYPLVEKERKTVCFISRPNANFILGLAQKALNPAHCRPRGYWTQDNSSNIKQLLDALAKKRNLDPQSTETWYTIPAAEIIQELGRSALAHYSFSVNKALMDLYPNIGLAESKFPNMTRMGIGNSFKF